MKLKYILIVLLCLLTVAPVAIFWFWPYSKALESEIDDVRQRHLVIAKNLSGEMERYYSDLTSSFAIIATSAKDAKKTINFKDIFDNLHIRHICIANSKTGQISESIQFDGPPCPPAVPAERFDAMMKLAKEGQTLISGVFPTKPNGNVIYALYLRDDQLFIGAISTSYIAEIGRRISFGKLGHAAIVDQNGRALSHPRQDWQDERKDMSKISVVQKMLAGKTGVEVFYSPALKADMIAGYTFVKSAGWGVMVPQPLAELQNKARTIETTAMYIMLIGFLVAAIIGTVAAWMLTRPVEKLVHAMEEIGDGNLDAADNIKLGRWSPVELKSVLDGTRSMTTKIKGQLDTIAFQANTDSTSGLMTNDHFLKVGELAMATAANTKRKSTVLQINLSDLHKVEDFHGRKTGVLIITKFAKRLNDYATAFEEFSKVKDPNMAIYTSRRHGNTFSVLINCHQTTAMVSKFIDGLLERVKAEYQIDDQQSLAVTVNVGFAASPNHSEDFADLMHYSEVAVTHAESFDDGYVAINYETLLRQKTDIAV